MSKDMDWAENMRQEALKALQMAVDAGASGARAAYAKTREEAVTALGDRLDKIHTASSRQLSLTIFADGRVGSFSTSRLGEKELKEFVERAVQLTSLLEPDEFNVMPDPSLCLKGDGPDLEIYDTEVERLTASDLREKVLACNENVLRTAPRGLNAIETEMGISSSFDCLADTQGLLCTSRSTLFTVSSECSLTDPSGARPESGWWDQKIRYGDLAPERCGEVALERGLANLGAQKVPSRRYDVILDTEVASKFVKPLIKSLTGAAQGQKRTFIPDCLDRKTFYEGLEIEETPLLKGAIGAASCDGEGIELRSGPIVEHGAVRRYFLNTYYAGKLGMRANGASPTVLTLSGTGTRAELLSLMDNGILITSFNGGNFNETTGDFSYGIRGFLVANGVIVRPIRENNVSGNFLDIWNTPFVAAADSRNATGMRIPSILFPGLSIS